MTDQPRTAVDVYALIGARLSERIAAVWDACTPDEQAEVKAETTVDGMRAVLDRLERRYAYLLIAAGGRSPTALLRQYATAHPGVGAVFTDLADAADRVLDALPTRAWAATNALIVAGGVAGFRAAVSIAADQEDNPVCTACGKPVTDRDDFADTACGADVHDACMSVHIDACTDCYTTDCEDGAEAARERAAEERADIDRYGP